MTTPLIPEDTRQAERTARCATISHPGSTYNPWLDKTWCACGAVIRDGNHAQHITCCGGPLDWRKR